MIDKQKVIKGLECCLAYRTDSGTDSVSCEDCPYHGTDSDCWQVERDALELLKEQEPVTPERRYIRGDTKYFDLYKCPECGYLDLRYKANYCGGCGKAVKWDDRQGY